MLPAGAPLNRYRILRPLGTGGMGEVYEAEDTRLKRCVAIKILPEGIASDPARLARFEHEAQAGAALNHPNIVTIHSVEEDGERRFLTMELIEGRTLDQLVPPAGLAVLDLFAYAIPLVDAVAAAHGRGIVHRDLKPGNVMVSADGRIKVLDFWVAKRVGAADAMRSEALEAIVAECLNKDPAKRPSAAKSSSAPSPGAIPTDAKPRASWAVDLATGARKRISAADAVYPRVSPDGRLSPSGRCRSTHRARSSPAPIVTCGCSRWRGDARTHHLGGSQRLESGVAGRRSVPLLLEPSQRDDEDLARRH